jgi:hypothetical protein
MRLISNFLLVLLQLITIQTVGQMVGLNAYSELADPNPVSHSGWSNLKPGTYVSFASADIRYKKGDIPGLSGSEFHWKTKAWKGEKVHTQFLIWTTSPLEKVSLEWNSLADKQGHKIAAKHITSSFVRYVMTDGLNSKGSGCGIPDGLDSSLVEDIIDAQKVLSVKANTTQPVWLSVMVPATTVPGTYKGIITIKNGSKVVGHLNYTIDVLNRTLLASKDWKFHLDLWQNPYSIARVYGLKPWSKEHMEAMRPYMKMLAGAGQKAITATIIYDPWNSQTEDVYGTMVKWIRNKDGSWIYDYSIFDHWVSYMMSLGINKVINCYSMIPWNLKFYYYDEAAGKDTLVVCAPGTPEYNAHWANMLKDFARHLKQKGWFDKTTIAMDERPMEAMQKAIAVIRNADKNLRISLAGNYHPEIEKDLFDYSVASGQVIENSIITERKKAGLNTTYYTCCVEGFPNTFTFSPPSEATWLGWYAANKSFNGYLRWAYSRFGKWSAGDTYLVYPGPMSSIRFERLIEGIQDFEKIRLLKQEFKKQVQKGKLGQLETILKDFELNSLKTKKAGDMLTSAKSVLNTF